MQCSIPARYLLVILTGFFTWSGLANPTSVSAVDIDDIERSVVQVVLEINGGIAMGTGFVLNAQGLIATNHHVVEQLAGALVVRKSGETSEYPARIIALLPQYDLAILQANGLGLPPIKLAEGEQKKGDEVWAFGFPGAANQGQLALDATFTKGVISRMEVSPWDAGGPPIGKIQHTASINGGNSGGPLTDSCGAVIGVNTRVALINEGKENANDVYLSSRISVLIGELKSRGIAYNGVSANCVVTAASGIDEQRVSDAEADAEEANKRAGSAEDAAKDAEDAAKGAIEETERLQGETDDLKVELGNITRQLIIWGPILAVLIIAAVGLALRKPRERIIRTVTDVKEGISRKIESTGSARRKRQAQPKYGLSLAGFDSRGSPVQVLMSKENFDGRFGSVVGRHPEFSDFTIQDTDVSRRHFRIFWEKAQAKIEDLNTTNGTVLNRQILTPFLPQVIGPGDRVLIGGIELTVSKL